MIEEPTIPLTASGTTIRLLALQRADEREIGTATASAIGMIKGTTAAKRLGDT